MSTNLLPNGWGVRGAQSEFGESKTVFTLLNPKTSDRAPHVTQETLLPRAISSAVLLFCRSATNRRRSS